MNASSAMSDHYALRANPLSSLIPRLILGQPRNFRRQGTAKPDSRSFGGPKGFRSCHPSVSAAYPHVFPDPSALRDSDPV